VTRTTLEIDDTVLAVARAIARDEGVSLRAAVSRLAEQGLRARATDLSHTTPSGFPVFTAPMDATPITLDVVNDYRDAD
jgi:hypothetical protein